MRRTLRPARALLVAITMATGGLAVTQAPAAADAAGDEAGFVTRVNQARGAAGLPALTVDSRIVTVARNWSGHMAGSDDLAHNPNLAQQAPADWTRLAENVGEGPSVDSLHTAFMNSASHRANILDRGVTRIGVGVVYKNSRLWVTQVFMAASSPPPASVSANGAGYRLLAAGGQVFSYGDANTPPTPQPASRIVGGAATPTGDGYWMVGENGAVHASGDAGFFGSLAGTPLAAPIVGMAATPTGRGYWLLGRDGGIFSYGDATFYGSTGALKLNQPVVGMTASPTGRGYWFVASDGGIFSFGDAAFYGSTGSLKLNQPVVGMAAAPGGKGYWLVARDGGIFAFGTAPFYGSTGSLRLNQPIVGMAVAETSRGYRFVAADGGIFSFGEAPYFGSTGGQPLPAPVVGLVSA